MIIYIICSVLFWIAAVVLSFMNGLGYCKVQPKYYRNIFGKLKTIFQMVAIPFVFLNSWPFSYFDSSWVPELRIANILIYIATAMSLISGIIYVAQNKGVLASKEEKHD